MDLTLIFSAFLLGLAGMPHCAAMCGAPCAAVVGGAGPGAGARSLSFHVTRVAGYALVGALAAAGVGILAVAGSAAPVVRPVWAMLHAAALALGIWLLVTGRQPAFMTRLGHRSRQPAGAGAGGWQLVQTPWTAAAAGSAWVAWPCGLLQSALVLAALANTPQAGGAAMAALPWHRRVGCKRHRGWPPGCPDPALRPSLGRCAWPARHWRWARHGPLATMSGDGCSTTA
jgi:uncharacterized protein